MTIVLLCKKHGSYEGFEKIRKHIYRKHVGLTRLCSLKNKNKEEDKFFDILSRYPDDFAISYG